MCSNNAVRVASCARVSKSILLTTWTFALVAMSIQTTDARGAGPGLVLWNKLGSPAEVESSAYGPNLGFFNSPNFLDVVGNPDFVPGVFGNGLSIGPGSYNI